MAPAPGPTGPELAREGYAALISVPHACTMWYMHEEETTRTVAGRGPAWTALTAVTTFPRWTESMTSVTPLDGEDLRVGNRFRIRQPGLGTMVWRVSEVRDGESFTWESHLPGVHTVGHHRLDRNTDGTTQITIGLRQTGVLAGLIGLLTATKTRRFLRLEAAGLQAAALQAAAEAQAQAQVEAEPEAQVEAQVEAGTA